MLRLADSRDEEFLRITRNNNREFFMDARPVDIVDHHRWFLGRPERDSLFIICVENKRVGTISLTRDGDVAMLGRFVILKQHRGTGLGHEVMYEFKKMCKEQNFQKITLEVKRDNDKARLFYVKEGFKLAKETEQGLSMEISI